jgi:hypothetical protein
MGVQYAFTGFLHENLTSLSAGLTFVILHGMISGLIAVAVYIGMRTVSHAPGFYKPIRPVFGTLMVILAVLFTVIL